MTIGIGQFRAPREQWLDRMLTQPFREDTADYPLGGRGPGPRPSREARGNL
jgi:hypothetical protein